MGTAPEPPALVITVRRGPHCLPLSLRRSTRRFRAEKTRRAGAPSAWALLIRGFGGFRKKPAPPQAPHRVHAEPMPERVGQRRAVLQFVEILIAGAIVRRFDRRRLATSRLARLHLGPARCMAEVRRAIRDSSATTFTRSSALGMVGVQKLQPPEVLVHASERQVLRPMRRVQTARRRKPHGQPVCVPHHVAVSLGSYHRTPDIPPEV